VALRLDKDLARARAAAREGLPQDKAEKDDGDDAAEPIDSAASDG